MINVEINGQNLDLSKAAVVKVSKRVGKIGDVSQRQGDLSISFDAPLNNYNLGILGQVTAVEQDKTAAFSRYNTRLTKGSLVVSSGFCKVTKIRQQAGTVSLQFFGGNSDWFDLISGQTLQDLNFVSLFHFWEASEIIASFNGLKNYVYFICDTGLNSERTGSVFSIEDFVLAVKAPFLFEQIFTNAGLKIGGSLFNDLTFRSEILPSVFPQIYTGASSFESDQEPPLQTVNSTQDGGFSNKAFFSLGDPLPDDFDGHTFTAAANYTKLTFNFEFIFTTFGGSQGSPADAATFYELQVDRGGSSTTPAAYTFSDINGNYRPIQTGTSQKYFDCRGGILEFTNVQQGDTFKFYQICDSRAFAYNRKDEILNNFNLGVIRQSYFKITREGGVSPATFELPAIKQGDFIKDIMFRHGYISTFDSKTKTVFFNKFDEVADNKIKASDWSQYIDRSKVSEINFTEVLEDYAKTNTIQYSEDENDLDLKAWKLVNGQNLGTGAIESESNLVQGEAVLYTSIFAPTSQRKTMQYSLTDPDFFNYLLPYLPMFETNQGTGSAREIVPRVLLFLPEVHAGKFNRSFNYIEIRDRPNEVGVNATYIGYAYFAKPEFNDSAFVSGLDDFKDSLAFSNPSSAYKGRTLIETSFGLYSQVLARPLMLKIPMRIPERVVSDLDQLVPVWVDYKDGTGYYYVDEVVQYDGVNSNEVKLVKV